MKREDMTAAPCDCGECIEADVSGLQRRRDPRSGVLLHGYQLRAWYDARDRFMSKARAAVGARGRHADGLEPLARKP